MGCNSVYHGIVTDLQSFQIFLSSNLQPTWYRLYILQCLSVIKMTLYYCLKFLFVKIFLIYRLVLQTD